MKGWRHVFYCQASRKPSFVEMLDRPESALPVLGAWLKSQLSATLSIKPWLSFPLHRRRLKKKIYIRSVPRSSFSPSFINWTLILCQSGRRRLDTRSQSHQELRSHLTHRVVLAGRYSPRVWHADRAFSLR